MVTTLDLLPTIANITESPLGNTGVLDGRNITQHLLNPESLPLKETPFYYYARNGDLEAVRLGKWKLHIAKSKGWNKKENGEFPVSLYDLENDIGENINLANDFPGVVNELLLKMEEFDKRLDNF